MTFLSHGRKLGVNISHNLNSGLRDFNRLNWLQDILLNLNTVVHVKKS